MFVWTVTLLGGLAVFWFYATLIIFTDNNNNNNNNVNFADSLY